MDGQVTLNTKEDQNSQGVKEENSTEGSPADENPAEKTAESLLTEIEQLDGTSDIQASSEEAESNNQEEVTADKEQHDDTETQPADELKQTEVTDDKTSGNSAEASESLSSVNTDDSEDEGVSDLEVVEELDAVGREGLFTRGKQHEEKGKKNRALKYYLVCIKNLTNVAQFPSLPQCLHKIADLYFEKEEYEKAVYFIQAEKVYYETALIDTSELQRKLEEKTGQTDFDQKALRAEEYENLAKLCLEREQPQLAMEYQAKATKIRQEIFGDNDPRTTESLDLFTVMYGEVGKKQYSESMQKLNSTDETPAEDGTITSQPTSILRQRSTSTERDEKKRVRFDEQAQTTHIIEEHERDEFVSRIVLWLVLSLLVLMLFCMGALLYCKMEPSSRTCAYWRNELYYYFIRFKYNVYYYLPFLQTQVGPTG